jgi:hypothetical protein
MGSSSSSMTCCWDGMAVAADPVFALYHTSTPQKLRRVGRDLREVTRPSALLFSCIQ